MLGAILSRPLRTVEPVVVMPDMVSKYASVKLIWLIKTKGNAEKALAIVHTREVMRNISLTLSRKSFVLPNVRHKNATAWVMSTALPNSRKPSVPEKKAARVGMYINSANLDSTNPITNRIVRELTIRLVNL